MSIRKPSKRGALTIFFVLGSSSHLLAEIIRRFVVYSNTVYMLADIALITFAFLVARTGSLRADQNIIFLFFAYAVFGVASTLHSQSNAMLLLIGARPIILALAVYVLAENYFRAKENAQRIFISMLGFWVVLILGVAIIQIDAGPFASINLLPSEVEAEFGGRGDYTTKDGGLEWLFRPTSIFMHTGRLGQYAFYLGLAICIPILLSNKADNVHYLSAALTCMLILISGQRAAAVFLIGSAIFAVHAFGRKKVILRLLAASVLISVSILFVPADLRKVVLDRVASGFTEGIDRALEMSKHWSIGFLQYPLFGEGLGFFSFGGGPHGGKIYYEYMPAFGGGGENSWLRIQGETGIPGLIIFFWIVALIALKSYRRAKMSQCEFRSIHLTCCLYAAFSMVWALTHDVYGNYLFLVPLFLLFGASSGLFKREMQDINFNLRQAELSHITQHCATTLHPHDLRLKPQK